MDDIAEGPERQRGWVPGGDNEAPLGRGKCGEALVTSISKLSQIREQLRAKTGDPRLWSGVDGSGWRTDRL